MDAFISARGNGKGREGCERADEEVEKTELV